MGPRSCSRPSTCPPCMLPSRLSSPSMPLAVPLVLSWTLEMVSPTVSPSMKVMLSPMLLSVLTLLAMQHHGLGHLPQPDNFTTCGRLGIEVNQYNNPIECYADETIDDMREEKVVVDHPELAEKMLKGNNQKHKEHQMNPIAAQKLKSANFDPKRSAVMMAINAQ